MTFIPERIGGASARPKHSGQFAFNTDEGGAENYQIALFDVKTGDDLRLTDGRSRNVGGRWSRSGKRLAFSSNARNGKDLDLYVVDPDANERPRLFKEATGSWTVNDWSPDDSKVVAIEYISINESYVHVVDVATGATERISPGKGDGEPISNSQVRWANENLMFGLTDHDSEFRRLVRYDREAAELKVLSENVPWDVDDYDLTDDGKTIAYVADEDGIAKVHVVDAETGEEKPRPPFPLDKSTA